MGLTIRWQALQDNVESKVPVVTDFAVLYLYLTDEVIQRSEWHPLSGHEANCCTSLQREVRLFLERPERCELNLVLRQQGTEFCHRVWQELTRIPFGETLTYAQLAQRVGSGARAVANACRSNPFPGLIPCHRVVAVNGIGGFMGQREGAYVELKRRILQYEAKQRR